jgi:hypothetical protein
MTVAPLIVNAGVRYRDPRVGVEDYTIPVRASPGTTRGRATPGSAAAPRTYDPESNLTFWGTGIGSPWFGDQRPGDNLYTSSTLAIDPDRRAQGALPVPLERLLGLGRDEPADGGRL